MQAIQKESISEDHERRARDSLRACKQKNTVAGYLSAFRNIILTIPGMTENEKCDKFVDGFKPKIQFEVRKANCSDFEECTKIPMRVEAAFSGMTYNHNAGQASSSSYHSDPMEIGNMESKGQDRRSQIPLGGHS